MGSKFTVSTTFKAIDGVSGPLGKMAKGANVAGNKINSVTSKIGKGFSAIGKIAKPIGVGMLAIGTAAVGAAAGIFKVTTGIASFGDEVAKTSRYLGISSDAFQEFRYIGERSGLTVSEMDTALSKLTVNLSKDTSEIEESLTALGLTAEQVKAAGPDEALNIIADGMANITDPSMKAKVAVDIFGRSGIKMVNVLGEGREGLSALADEAHRVGYVMDSEALTASEKLNDQMLNMKTSFGAVTRQIGSSFMPLVTKAVTGITEFMIKNKGAFDGIIESVMKFFDAMAPIASELMPVLFSAVQGFGKILSKVLTAAAPLFKTIGKFIAAILPDIIAIGESIAELLVPAFELLGPVFAVITPIIKGFVTVIKTVIGWVVGLIEKIMEFLGLHKKTKDLDPSLENKNLAAPDVAYRRGNLSATSTVIQSSTSTNKSDVNVNFNNAPAGTSVDTSGKPAPKIKINPGKPAFLGG